MLIGGIVRFCEGRGVAVAPQPSLSKILFVR